MYHPTGALLLPKLRSYFAEFLNEGSPDPLGILYPSTRVGLRYGRADLTRGFSRQHGLNHLRPYGHRHHPSGSGDGFPYRPHFPKGLAPAMSISTGWPTLLRPPFAQTILRGSGILTGCPSPTPLGLGLGPTNPTRINLPSETSDLRGSCFSHDLRYSCRHSHFCPLHQFSQSGFSADRTLPYRPSQSERLAASVLGLSPVTFSAQDHLTSELLRTL